jgi:hypothetical protein
LSETKALNLPRQKMEKKSIRIPHLTYLPVLAGVLGFGVTSLFARTPNKKPAARGDDLCSRHRSSRGFEATYPLKERL